MFATTTEIHQYARMTFKQYGLKGYTLEIMDELDCPDRIGQANPWEKKIELKPKCFDSFFKFKTVLMHEIAHCIQFARMGGTFKVNGEDDFHGEVFKQVCRELKISPSPTI